MATYKITADELVVILQQLTKANLQLERQSKRIQQYENELLLCWAGPSSEALKVMQHEQHLLISKINKHVSVYANAIQSAIDFYRMIDAELGAKLNSEPEGTEYE